MSFARYISMTIFLEILNFSMVICSFSFQLFKIENSSKCEERCEISRLKSEFNKDVDFYDNICNPRIVKKWKMKFRTRWNSHPISPTYVLCVYLEICTVEIIYLLSLIYFLISIKIAYHFQRILTSSKNIKQLLILCIT